MDKKQFIRNRPFDEVDATDLQGYLENSIKNMAENIYTIGVFSGLVITPSSGLTLTLSPGTAYDDNYNFFNVITNQNFNLNVANPTNPRYDIVSLRFKTVTTSNVDTANKYGRGTSFIYSNNIVDSYDIIVTAGVPAASPTSPSIPVGDVGLARIFVPAGASSIVIGNIVDMRTFVFNKLVPDLTDHLAEPDPHPQYTLDTDMNNHKVAAVLDHPNNSVTDAKIGNRTIDDTIVAATGADTPTRLWSKIGNMIKAITGKANWFTPPTKTLEDLNTHIGSGGASHAAVIANGANGFITGADKAKLDGVAANANNYVHPVNHPASIITQDANNRFFTDTERTKLSGIANNANNYAHPSGDGNLHVPATGTTNNTKVLKAGATAGSLLWAAVNASEIVEDASHHFVTDTEKTTWNGKANTASPTFTGTPAAPTAVTGTNTTQLATTEFVTATVALARTYAP